MQIVASPRIDDMRALRNILVTGGAGFIGSAFIRYMLGMDDGIDTPPASLTRQPCRIVNLDSLTYAGNLSNVADVEAVHGGKRYFFVHADICDSDAVERIMRQYGIDTIVHFAAESHVDRSIACPAVFLRTNVMGTFTLLEVARQCWTTTDGSMRSDVLFHHVSTDEVYGAQSATERCTEDSPLSPSSPYSSSKAASDLTVLAWAATYGLPVTLSRCSNNYGRRQYPEKLLPLMITHIKEGKQLPVYGTGEARRDWIHVIDHVKAIHCIMQRGTSHSIYNICGGNVWRNIDLLHRVIDIAASITHRDAAPIMRTIDFVRDRPAHDALYAMDCSKVRTLGWSPVIPFDDGLRDTVSWYLS